MSLVAPTGQHSRGAVVRGRGSMPCHASAAVRYGAARRPLRSVPWRCKALLSVAASFARERDSRHSLDIHRLLRSSAASCSEEFLPDLAVDCGISIS
eukprot:6184079-Pleurochrysis_carterae.AAC.3